MLCFRPPCRTAADDIEASCGHVKAAVKADGIWSKRRLAEGVTDRSKPPAYHMTDCRLATLSITDAALTTVTKLFRST